MMQQRNDWDSEKPNSSGWATIMLIGFGAIILAFLVGIERQNWFHIRPVTGTAVAMAYTSDKAVQAGEIPSVRAR